MLIIRPSQVQRGAIGVGAGFMIIMGFGLAVLLVATTGPTVGLPVGVLFGGALVLGAYAMIRNLLRPVVVSQRGIAGLRITKNAPRPGRSVSRIWRSRFRYQPDPIPWKHVSGCYILQASNQSATGVGKTRSYPVMVQLDDGRLGRTGFADDRLSVARRTVDTIDQERARWSVGP